jgi:hypothetical protein
MATIKADSELMTNYVAALPVPAGSKFSAILDENRRVMVLSLSNDTVPKLQFSKSCPLYLINLQKRMLTSLVRTGLDKVPVLIDMAALLSIPTGSIIETFCIRQGNELNLYMAVSYKNGPSTSALVVTRPFMPQALHDDKPLALIPGTASIGQAKMIYMVISNQLMWQSKTYNTRHQLTTFKKMSIRRFMQSIRLLIRLCLGAMILPK